VGYIAHGRQGRPNTHLSAVYGQRSQHSRIRFRPLHQQESHQRGACQAPNRSFKHSIRLGRRQQPPLACLIQGTTDDSVITGMAWVQYDNRLVDCGLVLVISISNPGRLAFRSSIRLSLAFWISSQRSGNVSDHFTKYRSLEPTYPSSQYGGRSWRTKWPHANTSKIGHK